jgi:hypothetical protein
VPVASVLNYLPTLSLLPVDARTSIYWLVYAITMVISLLGGMFVMPFWQSMKAVLYYDLRSRHEGLGLQLRDHAI